jgi:serine/threonine-protein kinase
MGEVYKARDTRLDRIVAIKICAAQFSERFEREARAIAALNHPNVCALYDVGSDYLVMEFVDGPTLANRIAAAPIEIDEALAIAGQIAEALQAAHEKGIVHRDLKPANVKLTAAGQVKVLDFGLAKAFDPDTGADPQSSPTLTLSATRAGVILGTAAYMSPEQARGIAADKRADIWAFGVVLYEMLARRQLFAGDTVSDTLAGVLKTNPDWSALPTATPASIRRLLRRCLQRDRKLRLHDIGDALLEIGDAREETEAPVSSAAAKPSRLWPWIAAVALAVVLLAASVLYSPAPAAGRLMRLSAELGPDAVMESNNPRGGLAISPDGTRIVFRNRGADGKVRLGVRLLDQSEVTTLAGTEGAVDPFFSPDGQSLAFFADGKLKKIASQGGVPVTLCDAPLDLGGSWGDDGNIIAALSLVGGLSRIPSAGGAPVPATVLNEEKGELRHSWPQVLPGSHAVLFSAYSVAGGFRDPNIEIQSFANGERKTLRRGFFARYLPSGHLVYVRQNTLFAAPFDLASLTLRGSPQAVLADINEGMDSGAGFDYSRGGTFVYLNAIAEPQSIFWLDRAGKNEPIYPVPGRYGGPRFSPDGNRLAFAATDVQGNQDIWVQDLQRKTTSRLTFLPGPNTAPVWTPDNRSILFLSDNATAPGIYSIRADRSGEPRRLSDTKGRMVPSTISPNGKRLAGVLPLAGGGTEIWTAPLEEGENPRLGPPETFLRSPFIKINPSFSPDTRWLAYNSGESGTTEVYVRPFPGPGAGVQISTGGGRQPMWSQNQRELFFQDLGARIMVVEYTARGDSFIAGTPRLWSERRLLSLVSPPVPTLDLAPDGQRFAVILYQNGTAEQKPVTRVTLLLNFFDELKRRAPPEKR